MACRPSSLASGFIGSPLRMPAECLELRDRRAARPVTGCPGRAGQFGDVDEDGDAAVGLVLGEDLHAAGGEPLGGVEAADVFLDRGFLVRHPARECMIWRIWSGVRTRLPIGKRLPR